jgi:hypothetical protein
MTSERDAEERRISEQSLQREDVQRALSGGPDLPEGARGGMEQAQSSHEPPVNRPEQDGNEADEDATLEDEP